MIKLENLAAFYKLINYYFYEMQELVINYLLTAYLPLEDMTAYMLIYNNFLRI